MTFDDLAWLCDDTDLPVGVTLGRCGCTSLHGVTRDSLVEPG